MAVWDGGSKTFTALAAAMCSRHVGRRPGFINEDEPVPIELPWLSRQAFRASRHPGDPALWHGRSFFARDLVALEEATDRPIAERETFLVQAITQFLDGDIGGCLEQGQDRHLMGIDPVGLAISP